MQEIQRLTDLEIRLAYLEDTLNALDAVVIRQAQDILRLENTSRAAYERMLGLQERVDAIKPTAAEPPPPHY